MIVAGEASPNVEVDEFLARRLFAHLATASDDGPRDSPVWFLWEGGFIWVLGNVDEDTFPRRIARDPRCAVGIVDFRPETGFLQHVGFRGTAEIVPFERERAFRLIRRYAGENVRLENLWFAGDLIHAEPATTKTIFVRFRPETVVVRDLSYSLDGRALKGAAVFAAPG